MTRPPVLILSGHGLNCEDETARAFALAGGAPRLIHLDALAAQPTALADAAIAAVPGGFSYGDDFGAGTALAARLRLTLGEALQRFVARGGLLIGICNGCQVLVALGLVGHGRPSVTMAPNRVGTYQCRWVHLRVTSKGSPWLAGLDRLFMPVAHGEGQFVFADGALARLRAEGMVGLTYCTADGEPADQRFPDNPNGSPGDVAGLTDTTGRVLALMPHPERAIAFHHRPDWPRLADHARRAGQRLPDHGDGLALFRNAIAAVR